MARVTKISSLIDELFNTVEALGVKKTLEVLKNSKQQNLTLQDERVDFILNTISKLYNISVEDILLSNDRGKRIFALKFLIYYLRESFYMNFQEIAKLIKKSTSYVFKKHQEMKEIKKNKKHILQSKFEKLDLIITEYQLKNR